MKSLAKLEQNVNEGINYLKTYSVCSKILFTFLISKLKHMVKCTENKLGRRKNPPQIGHSIPVDVVRLQGGKPIVQSDVFPMKEESERERGM